MVVVKVIVVNLVLNMRVTVDSGDDGDGAKCGDYGDGDHGGVNEGDGGK